MHRLLKRQVTKFLKKNVWELPPELQSMLRDIGEAYEDADRERGLLERVQALNAEEINVAKERERELAIVTSKLALLDCFARFVPREFLHHLDKKEIQDVVLGDAVQKNMAILFSDLRGFTTFSENMNVEDTFRFLNAYMSRMGPVIAKFGGFIDKFVGDAIMALFVTGGAEKAVRCAIEMRATLLQYNTERVNKGYKPVDAGIAINMGKVMLGTVGSADRMNTTVIGDPVNLTSRLESLTKTVGANILISRYVYEELPKPELFKLRHIGSVKVFGKAKAVEIFEVFDNDPQKVIERKIAYHGEFAQGLADYRNGDYSKARDLFSRCQQLCPEDLVASRYVERCGRVLSLQSAAAHEIALTQQK